MTITVQETRKADELATLTTGLIEEFGDVVPAGWIIRSVARNVQRLREVGVAERDLAFRVRPLVDLDLFARLTGTELSSWG